jgi:tRNA-Thr(GGU) m(6)t(6)A37 methyltransferase TsaA
MTSITAQVSLYPLHQESLSPAIDESLRIFRAHHLEVDPGVMSTLMIGDEEDIFAALQETFHHLAGQGDLVLAATLSNACPISPGREKSVTYTAIGYVENRFDEPTNADKIRAAESRIALDPTLTEGMNGLEPGQKMLVLYDFNRAQGFGLLQHPRGDDARPRRGVFSLRSPHRPNSIGLCEVEILAMEDNVLRVLGLDALNGTPVLDLKPG